MSLSWIAKNADKKGIDNFTKAILEAVEIKTKETEANKVLENFKKLKQLQSQLR